jgi:hypothetical protein
MLKADQRLLDRALSYPVDGYVLMFAELMEKIRHSANDLGLLGVRPEFEIAPHTTPGEVCRTKACPDAVTGSEEGQLGMEHAAAPQHANWVNVHTSSRGFCSNQATLQPGGIGEHNGAKCPTRSEKQREHVLLEPGKFAVERASCKTLGVVGFAPGARAEPPHAGTGRRRRRSVIRNDTFSMSVTILLS